MEYMLNAYKPDSYDYCRGCLMDSYESDRIVSGPLSEEELIKEIAHIKSIKLRINEAGYDISYSIYQPIDISNEKMNEIDNKVDLIVKEIIAQNDKKEKELKWQKEYKRLEKEKEKELATLKTLKEKYE